MVLPLPAEQILVQVPPRPYAVEIGAGHLARLERAARRRRRRPTTRDRLEPGRLEAARRGRRRGAARRAGDPGARRRAPQAPADRSRASTTRWSNSRSTAARRWSGSAAGCWATSAALRPRPTCAGIDIVHVPTTLLAQVDSAIGGKVGVNHPLGKNLIGAFHQPRLVVIDPLLVGTLPRREFRAGLYEVVKYGMTSSRSLFDRVGRSVKDLFKRDPDALQPVIAESCAHQGRRRRARRARERPAARAQLRPHRRPRPRSDHEVQAVPARRGGGVRHARGGGGRRRPRAAGRVGPRRAGRADPAARPAAVNRRSGDCRDGRGDAPRQESRRRPAALRAVHGHRRTRGGRRCQRGGTGGGAWRAWAFG